MREHRCYVHRRCQSETEVSGPEFQAMSDPLAGMKSTYCVSCEEQFPVDEFAWSDTGESIADYYARYRGSATDSDLWWCGNPGLFALAAGGMTAGLASGILIGVFTSLIVGVIAAVVLAIAGAVVGVVVRETVVAPKIVRRVCRVPDTRELQ